MSEYSLFSSYDLDGTALANRAVMAPMTRSRAIGSVPNELMATYYRQRASAGLIVTEGTAPSANGLGYARIPGVYNQEQADGWRLVTDAVHEEGGRIFCQLMHTGRVTHPGNLPEGARVVGASAVALEETKMWVDAEGGAVEMPVAEEMSGEEVEATIEEFVHATQLSIGAGFDGVELHGANGYLIDQFINPHTNRRSDEWGGSWEARNRFAQEVARRCVAAVGGGRVGIRLSPYGVFNEMPHFDETDEAYVALASELGRIGVAYIHIVDHAAMGAPAVPDALKDRMREAFGRTFILSGGYDFARANADLDAGRADLVAFGRPFLANPDLLQRFADGAALNDPRMDFFYTPGEEGYTDYPVAS
ncbi:MAG: alkene reductase [Gemmatimonadota bacterium]